MRPLSYAGRLQLLSSVIASIINFWLSAFRLPMGCIDEINKLSSAFLWSGPDLNPRRAKVNWLEVCQPKQDGGLGLRSIHDLNKVSCLKLIWRIVSSKPSLWVRWIQQSLIRKESFWSVKESKSAGSWMWRKLLKYRELAKYFHRVEVNDGETTSFWFDWWSPLGRLYEITGPRGCIDMGTKSDATVASALTRRRRRHRIDILNKIEDEIQKTVRQRSNDSDIPLWRVSADKFKRKFSSKDTWKQIRETTNTQHWHKGVWFKHSTPKYSFLTWLIVRNRLATGDRLRNWGQGQQTDCVFCGDPEETRNHLFFSSEPIWRNLVQNLLGPDYTADWHQLVQLLHHHSSDRII